MSNKYLSALIVMLSICFSAPLQADQFPFPQSVYAQNCDSGGDAFAYTTDTSTGQEIQFTDTPNGLTRTVYDRVKTADQGNGTYYIGLANSSKNLSKSAIVTKDRYQVIFLDFENKNRINKGIVVETGQKSTIYYACGPNSVAKLALDDRLSAVAGKRVCVGGCDSSIVNNNNLSATSPTIQGCQNRNSPTQAQIDATNKAGYGYGELMNQTAVSQVDPTTGQDVVGYVDPISRQFIKYCPFNTSKAAKALKQIGDQSGITNQCRAYRAAEQACAQAADVNRCIKIKTNGSIDPTIDSKGLCNFLK